MNIPGISSIMVPFIVTWSDFVFKRPRRFFEERDRTPDRYVSPAVFLVGNVTLSAFALSLPKLLRRETTGALATLSGVIATVALLLATFIIMIIAVAVCARVFREHIALADTAVGFAYATAVLPVGFLGVAPFMEAYFANEDPAPWMIVAAVASELALLAYVVAAVARANVLHGRRFARFAIASAAAVLLLRVAFYPAVSQLYQYDERTRSQRLESTPHAEFASVPCAIPVVTTGTPRNVTPSAAELTGTASFNATRTWFDFDSSPKLAYSVSAIRDIGVADRLRPGATYYFRYVAQNDCGAVRGEVRTFTTPLAP